MFAKRLILSVAMLVMVSNGLALYQLIGECDSPAITQYITLHDDLVCMSGEAGGGDDYIVLVDVSDPENPHVISYLEPFLSSSQCQGLEIIGDYLYVAACSDGVLIIDISDTSNPAYVDTLAMSGDAQDVVLEGDIAYIPAGGGGIHIYDVTEPANPVALGTTDVQVEAKRIVVENGIAYVAERTGGVCIYDVSSPNSTSLISTYDTPVQAFNIVKEGDFCYVAMNSGGLLILDVSNPADPLFVQQYNADDIIMNLAVEDEIVYLLGTLEGFISVLDVEDPYNIELLGEIETRTGFVDITVRDGIAYVPQGLIDLHVYDLNDPAGIEVLGHIDLTGYAQSVAIGMGAAYVASGDAGMHVVDIGDVTDMAVAATVAEFWPVKYIECNQNRVCYCYAGRDDWGMEWSYVRVRDTSSPFSPSNYYHDFNHICSRSNTALEDGLFYIGDYPNLTVIDITGESAVQLGDYPLSLCGFDVLHQMLYYLEYDGFRVFDVSNPAEITQIATLPLNTMDYSLKTVATDDVAYIIQQNCGITIIDIANPASPSELCELTFEHCQDAIDVVVDGDLLFVSLANWNTIKVFDVSVPATPVAVKSIALDYAAKGMCVDNGVLWAACGHAGLYALDLTELGVEETPPPSPPTLELSGYPNPFNPQTTIAYTLPQDGDARLDVYDIRGRLVKRLLDEPQVAGRHQVAWNAADRPSGVYLVRLNACGQVQTRRLVLLK